MNNVHCVNRKQTTKMFLSYLLQNLADSDKTWYILSWVNLSYRNVSVFNLAQIMLLQYLVKLSIRVLQMNSSRNCEPQRHQNVFVIYFTKRGGFWQSLVYIFRLNLPQRDVDVFYLS